MTKAYVDDNGNSLPIFRELSTEVVAYTGTAAESAALDSRCRLVRVWCTTDAYVSVGLVADASAVKMPITAKVAEYIPIGKGWQVSAMQITAGGNIHVTGLL
jgi:hypothetical protein